MDLDGRVRLVVIVVCTHTVLFPSSLSGFCYRRVTLSLSVSVSLSVSLFLLPPVLSFRLMPNYPNGYLHPIAGSRQLCPPYLPPPPARPTHYPPPLVHPHPSHSHELSVNVSGGAFCLMAADVTYSKRASNSSLREFSFSTLFRP